MKIKLKPRVQTIRQNTEDGNNAEGEDGSSILESLRKRICQGREGLREVRIFKLLDLYLANFTSG